MAWRTLLITDGTIATLRLWASSPSTHRTTLLLLAWQKGKYFRSAFLISNFLCSVMKELMSRLRCSAQRLCFLRSHLISLSLYQTRHLGVVGLTSPHLLIHSSCYELTAIQPGGYNGIREELGTNSGALARFLAINLHRH